MCKPKNTSMLINELLKGTYLTSAFSRTWSKQHYLPLAHD